VIQLLMVGNSLHACSYLLESGSDDSEEPWGGLTPPSAAYDSARSTPLRAHLPSAPSTVERVAGARGVVPAPGSVAARVAAIARASGEDDEAPGFCSKTARWFRHTYRYLRSVVRSVRALLGIRTYRCLLGGELKSDTLVR
jgi:hypothetical protein